MSLHYFSSLVSKMFCVAALATVTLSGCGDSGPERASISGQVTFDGQPVEDGTISFVPAGDTQGPVSGDRIVNGTYTIPADKGPVIGSHKVEIKATRKTGEKIPAVPPATGEMEVTEDYIPAKYNTETTLTADVVGGENKKDFTLTAN
ncbi:MAG: hypothetical protein WEB58_04925 [Planctomycetaceae bacterium]